MTQYQDLSGTKHIDFRFNAQGTYHNNPSAGWSFRKEAVKRSSGPGKVCPSCGITRSRANKCECNS